ncbi:transcription termination/antitermination protein NusA [Candidatus Kuenenbacteria bacterium CG23_combo_of_CG06-09_8_20_14_all_36_9]|uniref:Transcription termination/antitermination protein NusA n=1 Tax=Candidatus Kuenenbacteria bacterium CG10_big_fil_rev_8_21_14_0_10_36_11 TaxID=1974618 RepID=A0A2M6WAP3_9BACT|nr:MAG: transcription termination/antitermination protein NusA [Candidatus Kuenenbacteria bacterium CG23_combo_of_CG06-09_8_20_14_all_36_9]PIT89859.1 MAG: transcription termination/antitermination protein NusA [Candidatus Kuenenbacteria bacterium CG10_big_fil_rev_8_21_14_0_10_36_11]
MPEELNLAIQQICDEKGLSLEMVKETIEEALSAAYRKDFGDKKTQNIKVRFDLPTGYFEVFDVKEVVEDELKEKYEKIREEIEKLKAEGKEISEEMMKEIQEKAEGEKQSVISDKESKKEKKSRKMKKDTEEGGKTEEVKEEEIKSETEKIEEEEKKFNPRTMISLSEARLENKKAELGEQIIKKLEVPSDFGRMAAQTAKQVIIQKLREAERNNIFANFKDKVGELVNGTVQRLEGRVILVDLGPAIGVVIPSDQSRNDNYKSGIKLKFYLRSVEQTARGPEILLSRTHPEMLRRLFKLEVPEVNSGAVQIKGIARDAGFRSKIAVMAKENDLDPIGACIGQRGTRVQTIINELGGEKIDIIEWNDNLEKFIMNALAPAKILRVEIDEKNKIARAFVKEDQYSLAIGREGQNVRLAAQLAGLKIDVVMNKETDEKVDEKIADEVQTNEDQTEEKKTTE